MRSVRPSASGPVGAALFAVTMLAFTAGAAAQDGASAQLEGYGASGDEAADPLPGPRARPFVIALIAVPVMTYAGPVGFRGSEIVTLGKRFATTQIVGAGYVVNPRFRFGLVGIFTEAFSDLPPDADAWQFGGVAPVAIATLGRFVIGGGPIVGYRSGGTRRADVGAVVLSGASIPLGQGVALNVVLPISALFVHRTTASIGVAIGIAKVF